MMADATWQCENGSLPSAAQHCPRPRVRLLLPAKVCPALLFHCSHCPRHPIHPHYGNTTWYTAHLSRHHHDPDPAICEREENSSGTEDEDTLRSGLQRYQVKLGSVLLLLAGNYNRTNLGFGRKKRAAGMTDPLWLEHVLLPTRLL